MVWPRWIFLRALGLIFGSAFYSLVFQIHGLIGPNGILPATLYLDSMREAAPGIVHLWAAPTLLWFATSDLGFMSGGELVNGKAGGEDQGDLRGESIRGGVSKVLKAGDVMFVPAGAPHGFVETKDHVTFIMVRFDTK